MALFEILGTAYIAKELIGQQNKTDALRKTAELKGRQTYHDASGVERLVYNNRRVVTLFEPGGWMVIKDVKTGEIIKRWNPEEDAKRKEREAAEKSANLIKRNECLNDSQAAIEAYLADSEIASLISQYEEMGFKAIPWQIPQIPLLSALPKDVADQCGENWHKKWDGYTLLLFLSLERRQIEGIKLGMHVYYLITRKGARFADFYGCDQNGNIIPSSFGGYGWEGYFHSKDDMKELWRYGILISRVRHRRDKTVDEHVYDYQKAAKMFWEVNVEQERHLFKALGFNKELYWNWVMERLYTGRVHDMNGDEIESYYTLQEELEWISPWVEKKIFKYKYK